MSGPQALLEDLGRNIALVLGLILAFGWVRGFASGHQVRLRGVLCGLLFGVASIASISAPVRLAPGVFMDMRNVLVALAFVFEGPIAGLLAGAMAVAYRVSVAGTGYVPGALLIIAAMALGAAFYKQRGQASAPSSRALLALGACISVAALTLTFLLVLDMPFAAVIDLVRRVSPAVFVGYPLGTLLVGTLLSYEAHRREAERALRHERDLLQRVCETSPASIVVNDLEGRIVMANAQAEKVLGVGKGTLMERAYNAAEWRITDFEGRPVSDAQLPFRRIMEERVPVTGMCHAIEVAGRRVFLSINGAPMFDEQGVFAGTVMALEDVTERMNAQRRLHDSEEKFRTLFNRTSEAIFVQPLSEEGVGPFVEVNDLACSWTGRTREELSSLTFADVDSSHEPWRVRELFRAARDRPVTFEAELRAGHGGEGVHAVEIVAHFVMLMGKPVIMALARDLSERRTLEAQVRQSQKMEVVGRLAGGIAHDFNNLLGMILLCSESIERDAGSGTTPQLAREIRHSAERGSALTKQLLAFSRKQLVVPRTIVVSEALDSMLKLFRRLIPSDITLQSQFEDGGACVRMDLGQLEQVVLNLVINARDAIAGRGHIEVTTGCVKRDSDAESSATLPAGNYVLLRVRDDGAGMSEEVIKRAFEPFFTTKHERGTGLGLSICFGIVKEAGGAIEVESKIGVGTTFRVYLPAMAPLEATKPPKPASAAARKSPRILLVEDEPSLRFLVRGFLTEHGYEIADFSSAEQALAHVDTFGVGDLLLTDIVMPGMSGPALAQILLGRFPGLPIVYMSGYAADTLARYGLDARQVRLVHKPFSIQELIEQVRQALQTGTQVSETTL